jgi:hypothetical protein
MSRKRRLLKSITKISKKKFRQFLAAAKKQIIWLLRTIIGSQNRRSSANAGFVLPTVAMISVVVVLLTAAIMFRSFDRARNANNVRVSQAVMASATPAIDRARAKINKLFADKRIPKSTPSDDVLYDTLANNIEQFSFGDETPLKLTHNGIESKTAWRFPVDTDNNGKFDSFTLYGIYFKSPPVEENKFTRARNPLEARSLPMTDGNVDDLCGGQTSALLIGNTGWIRQGNKFKKAMFVYTTTVPITTPISDNNADKYEIKDGNTGFSALEYQQDRVQYPPNNNAVVYEDDLAITPGVNFRLNGRIVTNSNLLTGSGSANIRLYQVSSTGSCFYEAENGKIIVGGNLLARGFTDTGDSSRITQIDLYKKSGTPTSTNWTNSITPNDNLMAYNNLAYVQRVNRLVEAQMANSTDTDPSEVKEGIEQQKELQDLSTFSVAEEEKIRRQQLQLYFRKRTRRVPYREVAFGGDALDQYATASPLQGDGDALRPIDEWMYPHPLDDNNNTSPTTSNTGLSMRTSGNKMIPSATETQTLKDQGQETFLGDRVLVGNNLPEQWWDKQNQEFVGIEESDTQNITGIVWDNPTTKTRTRRSLVRTLADVGSTERDGEWEAAAAQVPSNPTDPVGGLRVVTGAGIYLPNNNISTGEPTIWPDTNPVPQAGLPRDPYDTSRTITEISPYWMYDFLDSSTKYSDIRYRWRQITNNNTPFLRMRATAVYHYAAANYDQKNPKPIACVSSFYVPTNSTTAKNDPSLPAWASDPASSATGGLSNNGIVYGPPTRTVGDYRQILDFQASLKYPNGRSIDDRLLESALSKTDDNNRTLSEQSAIDSQICALQILDGTIGAPTNAVIPHGAIREVAFLDGRQVEQVSPDPTSTTYDLPTQDRQPSEVRATVLDVNLLRRTTIGSGEYLLPNSGIIYAARNDALRDLSSNTGDVEADKSLSAVDYILDPTRRPNGIMLINGAQLFRGATNTYREAEKGLILATNLPAYVKGDFNLHTQQEFTTALANDWGNFYTRTRATLNPNFACRPNDPRLPNCTTGDNWRQATVLADSITLLSGNFREGFREEGDFDWNDSYVGPPTLPAGFSSFNNYVTLTRAVDPATGAPRDLDAATAGFQGSSYLNNFVTPVAPLKLRPGNYLTEVCVAANPANCNDPTQWTITTSNGNNCENNGNNSWNDKIIGKNGDPGNNRIKTGYVFSNSSDPNLNGVDTSSNCFSPNAPRRIAARVNTSNTSNPIQVLAVDKNPNTGAPRNVELFTFGSDKSNIGTDLSGSTNAYIPWLRPVVVGGQLRFEPPILQFNRPFATVANPTNNQTSGGGSNNNWLQRATSTTFNLVVAVGDSPARPTEDNGGLHNFVRFIEDWGGGSSATINGAFIQVKKSAYSSAPFFTSLSSQPNTFTYNTNNGGGRLPFYHPPERLWGYDVGLLSQTPDLFAQKLVTPSLELPDEFFREVGRDDTWVSTLLCAKKADDENLYAIDDVNQRPSICKA